jgi:hypothetical protein
MHPKCASYLLTDEGIAVLLDALCGGGAPGGHGPGAVVSPDTPPEIVQNLLLMLLNCGSRGKATAGPEKVGALHNVVSYLQGSGDPGVSDLAGQVATMFD